MTTQKWTKKQVNDACTTSFLASTGSSMFFTLAVMEKYADHNTAKAFIGLLSAGAAIFFLGLLYLGYQLKNFRTQNATDPSKAGSNEAASSTQSTTPTTSSNTDIDNFGLLVRIVGAFLGGVATGALTGVFFDAEAHSGPSYSG